MHSQDSSAALFIADLMTQYKTNSDVTDCNAPGLNTQLPLCSFSFMTNKQWLTGNVITGSQSVVQNSNQNTSSSPLGYVEEYPSYSQFESSPEWGHWFAYNEHLPQAEPTMERAYASLNLNDYFNNIKF